MNGWLKFIHPSDSRKHEWAGNFHESPRHPVNLQLQLRFELDQSLHGLQKVLKSHCWHHNGIASTADILGDLEESSSLVLFQIEEKYLSFDGKLF